MVLRRMKCGFYDTPETQPNDSDHASIDELRSSDPPWNLVCPERALTQSDWNGRLKRNIFSTLCKKGDPPPRCLKCGTGSPTSVLDNIIRILNTDSNARIERGWKVYLIEDENEWDIKPWKAVQHFVIKRGDGVYTCPTQGAKGEYDFVFLPSSRVCPKISDSDLVLYKWTFPKMVVGGDQRWVDFMCGTIVNMVKYPELTYQRLMPTIRWDILPNTTICVPIGFKKWAETYRPCVHLDYLATLMNIPTMTPNSDNGTYVNMSQENRTFFMECQIVVDDLTTSKEVNYIHELDKIFSRRLHWARLVDQCD